MRSIVYILLSLFIVGILITSIQGFITDKPQICKLQCVENNVNPELLEQSAAIIKNRFKSFGLNQVNIVIQKDKCSLLVDFTGNVDLEILKPLVTLKGKIGFYETCNRSEIIKLLEEENRCLKGLIIPLDENGQFPKSEAILGFCKAPDKTKVETQLLEILSLKSIENIQFVWGNSADESGNYILFLLKKNVALDKSKILQSAVLKDKTSDQSEILINFNASGKQLWQTITKNNIGKVVALVLDNEVYFAPKVMSEIKDGRCIISGDFSLDETKCLNSIINTAELPLEFKIVK